MKANLQVLEQDIASYAKGDGQWADLSRLPLASEGH